MATSDASKKKFTKRKIIKQTLQNRRLYKKNCIFCKTDTDPDYKNYDGLQSYVSDRARILGRVYTGLCNKHQRKLSQAIKRARHLGLLPYISAVR